MPQQVTSKTFQITGRSQITDYSELCLLGTADHRWWLLWCRDKKAHRHSMRLFQQHEKRAGLGQDQSGPAFETAAMLRMVNIVICPETWTLKKNTIKQLETFEMWAYRRIGSWVEKRRSDKVLEKLYINRNTMENIKKQRLVYLDT